MREFSTAVYRVGQCVPQLVRKINGCMAQFAGGVLMLFVFTTNPEEDGYRADVNRDKIELALFTYHDVITFAMKIGELPWQDAQYSPHFNRKEDLPNMNAETLRVTLVRVDGHTGRVLALRSLELPQTFSKQLIRDVNTILQEPFDEIRHYVKVWKLQQQYAADQIGGRMAQARAIFPKTP